MLGGVNNSISVIPSCRKCLYLLWVRFDCLWVCIARLRTSACASAVSPCRLWPLSLVWFVRPVHVCCPVCLGPCAGGSLERPRKLQSWCPSPHGRSHPEWTVSHIPDPPPSFPIAPPRLARSHPEWTVLPLPSLPYRTEPPRVDSLTPLRLCPPWLSRMLLFACRHPSSSSRGALLVTSPDCVL